MKIDKKHLLNYSILVPYLILSVIGLLMVYSATSANQIYYGYNPFRPVINQTIFTVISLLAIWFIYRLRLDFLRKPQLLSVVIIFEIVLLALARFVFPTVNGAHGWINIAGFFTFQPAEYLKIIVVWLMTLHFSRWQEDIGEYDYQSLFPDGFFPRSFNDWRAQLGLMLLFVCVMPDLGNAAIVTLTAIIMFSISGISYRWYISLMGCVTILSGLTLGLIAVIGPDKVAKIPGIGYIAKRFTAYFNPFTDLSGAGHQLAHSYYAISNGGWFGRGLGNSIEKNGYLPEAQTDFIFSIVIEELGLIGGALILALLFFLILRILLVGIKAKDPFNSMLALGIGSMFLVQVFVNIGGISGLIPSTGVTFPFLSQGGNSVLVLSASIAIVLNIDANEKRAAFARELEEIS